MEQYISKSALVAEINQRIKDYKSHKIDDSYHDGLIFALEDLRDDFIDTLEVKEVREEPVSEVWHDAWKEEPEKGRKILVKDANTNCCFVSSFEVRKSWEDTYQGYDFRLWAYIDDILNL